MAKEKEFDFVEIKSDSFNKVIKFEELKALQNLNKIKQFLFCPTPGCSAKLIWVNAKQPYLKALHNKDHNPDVCPHYREKGVPYRRSSQRTVLVNLPGNAILARLDRLASSALPLNNNQPHKKDHSSKSRKTTHKIKTDSNKISTHGQLSDLSNAIQTSKIHTRISRKQINAITDKDVGSTFQIAGQVQKFEQVHNSQEFKITIQENKVTLKLILDNDYFTKEPSYQQQHVYDCISNNFLKIQGPLGIGCLALIISVSTNLVIAKLTRANSIKFFLWDTSNHRRHYTPLLLANKIKKDDQKH